MFYIIENQHRPDGIINNTVTTRQTFASALSFYHDRFSKMVVSEQFTEVNLLLTDDQLHVIQQDDVTTLYHAAE